MAKPQDTHTSTAYASAAPAHFALRLDYCAGTSAEFQRCDPAEITKRRLWAERVCRGTELHVAHTHTHTLRCLRELRAGPAEPPLKEHSASFCSPC